MQRRGTGGRSRLEGAIGRFVRRERGAEEHHANRK
jgi:hypothetical protein